jgi:hypothetical protein
MTQDVTAIIDGIKGSIEAVGRSGRDAVYLDNVSFRINASKLDVPHDSGLVEGQTDAEEWLASFDLTEYSIEEGRVFVNNSDTAIDIVCLQTLPAERTSNGLRIDMTVTVSSSDAANELPQQVLLSELFLHELSQRLEAKPGRISFNIAYAYVLWEDVERLVEDEIEIPR